MEKKKILICYTSSLDLGGIERSLLGLLDAIDYNKYEVDLFLYAHHGPLFHLINKNVHILPEIKELAYLRESLQEKIKNRCYYSVYLRLYKEFINRKISNDDLWKKVLNRYVKKNMREYDIAIGFFLPFDYINDYVNAQLKIGWIHTDYNKEPHDYDSLLNQYSKMDYIVAVSEAVKFSFVQLFPSLRQKLIVIENILSKDFIYQESNQQQVKYESDISLLSIGRFCNQKNFDNVPNICKRILDMGIKVKWYLIGFGGDEELIRKKIQEENMQDYVIILGKKDNPYPYIKACDFYIQPSRYEGKAVTVREAQILCKPVVITQFPTSSSQLIDGYDGIIVPMDNKGCAQGIVDFINNTELQDKIINNLKNNDYSNSEEINKIYALMGDIS